MNKFSRILISVLLIFLFCNSECRGQTVSSPLNDASQNVHNAVTQDAYHLYLKATDGDQEALYGLRQKAELGDKEARSWLSEIYFSGEGVKKNFSEAAHWAGCPKPDEVALEQCRQEDQLPMDAVRFLKKMRCDITGIGMHLKDNGDEAYQVCCHEFPHGPCGAIIIVKTADKWEKIGDVSGYDDPCANFYILKSEHNGFHDICLPVECSQAIYDKNKTCVPTIWQYQNGHYLSVDPTQINLE